MKIISLIYTIVYHPESEDIQLNSFGFNFENTSFEVIAHNKLKWMPVAELLKWRLAPADIPLSGKLIYYHKGGLIERR